MRKSPVGNVPLRKCEREDWEEQKLTANVVTHESSANCAWNFGARWPSRVVPNGGKSAGL